MIVLEHDAKELLAVQGVPVPGGIRMMQVPTYGGAESTTAPSGPWVIKAQIPSGKRAQAGGILFANSAEEIAAGTKRLLNSMISGHRVDSVRVERKIEALGEVYLSLSCDTTTGGVRIIVAPEGGSDIETLSRAPGAVLSEVVVPDPNAVIVGTTRLSAGLPSDRREAITAAAKKLAPLFFGYEALLLEINPLMILPEHSWTAGDVKLVIDENALYRHPELIALIERRQETYVEIRRKQLLGLDYLVLDPEGDIGLMTTGAGLSMMLIDELKARGLRPYNFLDARTGMMREPSRLASILRLLAEGAKVRVILMNVFAGITHLGEFAGLVAAVLEQLPDFRIPIVARLTGNGEDEARSLLAPYSDRIVWEPDLSRAIERTAALAHK